jgi:anaerobic selenocysteine-containing dehydrogenase
VFSLSQPVLAPKFETRHPGDVLIQLARSLGGSIADSFPWESYEDALKQRVMGLAEAGSGRVAEEEGVKPWEMGLGQPVSPNYESFDDLWERLVEHTCWFDTSEAMPSWSSAFQTRSGKFEFYCQGLREFGVEGGDLTYLPHYRSAIPSGDPGNYPLLLVPYERLIITNGPLANPPFLTKMLFDFELKGNDLFVEINPKTASKAGLREGDRVALQTERGELNVRVHLTEAARPEVIFVPMGLGHTAFDPYIQGKGVNANEIVVARLEKVSGLATWWGTRAKILKI